MTQLNTQRTLITVEIHLSAAKLVHLHVQQKKQQV